MKTIFTTVLMLTASIFSSVKAQIHPTNGLVEYFSFDNTLSGSEGGLMVAETQNFSTGYVGGPNGAYSVNGPTNTLKSDTVIDGFPGGNSSFTVCFWVKLNANTTASLFNYRGFEGAEVNSNIYTTAMAYDNNKLILAKAELAEFTELNVNYTYNSEWHHIAWVHFDSGSNLIYMDGESIGSTMLSLNSPNYANSRLQIGRSPGGVHFGDFEIDEFLIYDRTLSSAELLALASVAVGLNESMTNQIYLYPNPATDVVAIQNIEVGSTISIVDVSGKIVYTTSTNNSTTEINVSDFVSGMYFVQVTNQGNLVSTQKLQVK